jgi:hypothetical protein
MVFEKNKSLLFILFLTAYCFKLYSQTAITSSSAYLLKSMFANNEKNFSGSPGWSLQFGYSLPISSRRIEFTPELTYARFQNNHHNIALAGIFSLYPLDLNGDCSCPEFGKNKFNFRSKFRVGAGPLVWLSRAMIADELNTYTLRGYSPGIQLFAGLDFPIGKRFILSPLIQSHLLFTIPVFSEGNFSYNYTTTDNFIGMAGIQLKLIK